MKLEFYSKETGLVRTNQEQHVVDSDGCVWYSSCRLSWDALELAPTIGWRLVEAFD